MPKLTDTFKNDFFEQSYYTCGSGKCLWFAMFYTPHHKYARRLTLLIDENWDHESIAMHSIRACVQRSIEESFLHGGYPSPLTELGWEVIKGASANKNEGTEQ